MELVRKPILRVPLVLALTGLVCRCLTYLIGFVWGRIQIAQGPNPATGAYELSTGYMSEIMAVIAFLLFWTAGWKFVRGVYMIPNVISAAAWAMIYKFIFNWMLLYIQRMIIPFGKLKTTYTCYMMFTKHIVII